MSETVHSGPGGGPERRRRPFRIRAAAGERRRPLDGEAHRARRDRAVVVLWIAIKAADNFSQFVTVTLNGLSLSALYFVVASGFTLIFGLMRVVNMAHGTLYLFGGYLALNFQQKLFAEDGGGLNLSLSAGGGGGGGEYNIIGWVVPLAMAVILIGILGIAIQQLFLRWNSGPGPAPGADHDRDLRGGGRPDARRVRRHRQGHQGAVERSRRACTSAAPRRLLPARDRRRLGAADRARAVPADRKTRYGKIVRAGVDDRDMVSALGINVQLVFAGAFFIGAMLAGYGGVLGGTMLSLQPGEDTSFLLNSLIVVIIGGMGSLGGAAIGALALGLVDAYADVYLIFGDHDLTNYSILLTFALLVVVLAVRPLGLFGRPA